MLECGNGVEVQTFAVLLTTTFSIFGSFQLASSPPTDGRSVRHLLWWMIQRLQSFSGLIFVDEIRRGRLVVWYYRLLGAKLGRDVFLNTVRVSEHKEVKNEEKGENYA